MEPTTDMSIIKIEKQNTEHDGERNKLEHY